MEEVILIVYKTLSETRREYLPIHFLKPSNISMQVQGEPYIKKITYNILMPTNANILNKTLVNISKSAQ